VQPQKLLTQKPLHERPGLHTSKVHPCAIGHANGLSKLRPLNKNSVDLFLFEGLLVYGGEFSPDFPLGLVEPSHFGQPPCIAAGRSISPLELHA